MRAFLGQAFAKLPPDVREVRVRADAAFYDRETLGYLEEQRASHVRPVPEEPSAQLHLFQMGGYTYQGFVTNLTLRPLNLWRLYNRRATAELIIRELKDTYALGKIPSHAFLANEAFFQLAVLAHNLLNWLKRLCVTPRLQRATLHRLRQRLFVAPAQLTHPGGVPTLHIAPSYAYGAEFLETLERIRQLRSPLSLRPPSRQQQPAGLR